MKNAMKTMAIAVSVVTAGLVAFVAIFMAMSTLVNLNEQRRFEDFFETYD